MHSIAPPHVQQRDHAPDVFEDAMFRKNLIASATTIEISSRERDEALMRAAARSSAAPASASILCANPRRRPVTSRGRFGAT